MCNFNCSLTEKSMFFCFRDHVDLWDPLDHLESLAEGSASHFLILVHIHFRSCDLKSRHIVVLPVYSQWCLLTAGLCNCCYFYRVDLELTVPGACRDSLGPRYHVYHIHNALQYFIVPLLKCVVWSPNKNTVFPLLCRETEASTVWPDFLVKKDTE